MHIHIFKYTSLLLVMIAVLGCGNKCDDSNRINNLIKEVLYKDRLYLYLSEPAYDNRPDINNTNYFYHLSSNKFIGPGDTLQVFSNIMVFGEDIKVYKDTLPAIVVDSTYFNKNIHTISFNFSEVNEDTTKLKLDVSLGYIIARNHSTFNYEYNRDSCKWVMLDSTFWEY